MEHSSNGYNLKYICQKFMYASRGSIDVQVCILVVTASSVYEEAVEVTNPKSVIISKSKINKACFFDNNKV